MQLHFRDIPAKDAESKPYLGTSLGNSNLRDIVQKVWSVVFKRNYSRVRETKELRQLNATWDSALNPFAIVGTPGRTSLGSED